MLPERIKNLQGSPKLKLMRHEIEKNREKSPLFDTKTWVNQLEFGLIECYKRKVDKKQGKSPDGRHIYVKDLIRRAFNNN